MENIVQFMRIIDKPRNFAPDERWEDYVDLLPGFSLLDKNTAYTIYSQTSGIDYKPAQKINYKVEEPASIESIDVCDGIGCIEIASRDGIILFAKELKRAFLYRTSNGNLQQLQAVAGRLMQAAGWGGNVQIDIKGDLQEGEAPPYYELGVEIETEHRRARIAEYAIRGRYEARPIFIRELMTYYAEREDVHLQAVQAASRSDSSVQWIGWELDASRLCAQLQLCLEELIKLGLHKIHSDKAKDDHYQQVFQNVSALLEKHGKTFPPFHRRHSPQLEGAALATTPAEGVNQLDVVDNPPLADSAHLADTPPDTSPGEQEAPSDEAPSSLDHALLRLREGLDRLRRLSASHQHDDETQLLGQIGPIQRCFDALQKLNILLKHGAERIGKDERDLLVKILSQLENVQAALEGNSGAVLQTEMPTGYAFPQERFRHTAEASLSGQPTAARRIEDIEASDSDARFEGAAHSTTTPPGRRVIRRVVGWAQKHAPALLVGGATGVTVRLGAHFALAKLAITLPGFAAAVAAAPVASAIVSAVAIGALAGGATRLAVAAMSGRGKVRGRHWRRDAFLQGAFYGALGGTIGLGVADLFKADGFLHSLFQKSPIPSSAPGETMLQPSPQPHIVADPPPLYETPVPRAGTVPSGPPALNGIIERPHIAVEPPPPQDIPAPVNGITLNGVKNILTTEELKSLSPALQKLAESDKPDDILRFCKEASFHWINGSQHSPSALQSGARLIAYALDVAEKSGAHNHLTEQLHADEAYLKAWGIGGQQDIPEAIRQAKLSGHAEHHYGRRLLTLLKQPTNG